MHPKLGPNVGSVLHYFATAALATLVVFAEANAFAYEVHYSPEERLDAIDAALIGSAKRSIDFASYANRPRRH